LSAEPEAADFILLHARQVLTCAGPAPRRGPDQADAGLIDDGAIAAFEGRLTFVGPSASLPASVARRPNARVIDLRHRFSIVPGFVDAHTHAAFAGDRRAEIQRRLAGETYAEIAASGGGIVSTVSATRAASDAELAHATHQRLDEMLGCGTTTCEIKSGYGLTTAAELKILRAIRTLARTHRISIVSTFMGAHEVPIEFRAARSDYVDLVVDEMIPAVAGEALAEWCDVFCENGVFTPSESERILVAGSKAGLKPRIHADELASSGGAQVAARIRARSADHLIFVSPEHIRLLADAGTTAATLLPIAAFYLKLGRFAPARALIDAGVPVAIATDLNPGGGLSPSMPFCIALACFAMNMTFEEALVAATINGAWSLDRADAVGSLEPGKLADAVVVDGDAINLLRVGASAIRGVVKRGDIVRGDIPQPTEKVR
jgi:imidazolonepropionase